MGILNEKRCKIKSVGLILTDVMIVTIILHRCNLLTRLGEL